MNNIVVTITDEEGRVLEKTSLNRLRVELLKDFPNEEINPTLDDLAEEATALIKSAHVAFKNTTSFVSKTRNL